MMNTNELIDQVTDLVSLPDIYLRVQQLIDDPKASLGDIGKVICTDPALTARLLKIANSPFFGLAAKIETVSRAISVMGTQQLHDLLLATSVATTFDRLPEPHVDMKRFWTHSIRCAIAARLLAYECNVLDSERLFVAGLLHDIGHMVMYQLLPEQSADAASRALATRRALPQIERELFGFDYAEVGCALLKAWHLPAMLLDTVAYQNEPHKAESFPFETAIVHVATRITAATEAADDSEPMLAGVAPFATHQTKITEDKVVAVQARVQEHLAETMALLVPGMRMAS
jgi:HD-like signal output (HDOD) protein